MVGERGNLSTGRIAVLFTAEQMQRLTEWLQAIREIEEGDVRGELERLLQPLPQTVPGRKKRGEKVGEGGIMREWDRMLERGS